MLAQENGAGLLLTTLTSSLPMGKISTTNQDQKRTTQNKLDFTQDTCFAANG